MKISSFLAFFVVASPCLAQDIVTADEFDSYSVGTTLYFSEDGLHYGSEQFLKNRRTVWRAEDGSCVNGKWAALEDGICFLYDGETTPHCWVLTRNDGTIMIESMFPADGEPTTMLDISGQDTVPILCTGPSVGV